MAHFRGTLQGSRGEASRLGTKNSGLKASIDGWDLGLAVDLRYDPEKGEDFVVVWLTSGSNGYGSEKRLGVFRRVDLDKPHDLAKPHGLRLGRCLLALNSLVELPGFCDPLAPGEQSNPDGGPVCMIGINQELVDLIRECLEVSP